jgi:hypothetical protein
LPFLPDRFVNPVAVGQTQRDDTEKLVIIERVSAGPASQFIILARGKQRYLLHLSQHGITEIDRFSDDKPDATT